MITPYDYPPPSGICAIKKLKTQYGKEGSFLLVKAGSGGPVKECGLCSPGNFPG